MKRINLPTAAKNLKENFLLLVSTVAALCLFLSPSLMSLFTVDVLFAAVLLAAVLNLTKPPVISSSFARRTVILITILIAFMGYDSFKTAWMPFSKAAALANALHLTTSTLLMIAGLVGCLAGFYAMYTFSCWIVIWAYQLLKERLHEQRKAEMVANLKHNWYFPISAMAFFCISATLRIGYFIGMPIAFTASLVLASQFPSLLDFAKQNRIELRAVSILTALGICWGGKVYFCSGWSFFSERHELDAMALENMLPVPIDIISIFGAVVAIPFIYFCVLLFWKKFTKTVSEDEVFNGITVTEQIVYSILIIASLALVVASFAQTEAFYGTEYAYDIIYTSDSPHLVKGNVYLALTHSQNDLRQPLFAVFAAPFIGIPYLFGKLLGASASVQAMLVNTVQIVMLFAANFMLTKIMKLNPFKRVCFMLLASCTYTHLLFTLMMEQYIVAYFWLIFCMYLIAERQHPNKLALWGAGGTLLTSMVLLPFMSDKNPIRNFKEWFADMVKYGLEFVAVMLAFCRFDVIFHLTTKISDLSGFTGLRLPVIDKLYQYFTFVSNYFIAPEASVDTTTFDHVSWRMDTVTSINFIGIAILLLVIAGAVLNRDKKSSLLAAGWVAFSGIILVVGGWGAIENGLILYSLYFGWAFLVLLFQLLERIENRLNAKFLVPVFSIGFAVTLAVVNIPAIMEMVNFAITCFPV